MNQFIASGIQFITMLLCYKMLSPDNYLSTCSMDRSLSCRFRQKMLGHVGIWDIRLRTFFVDIVEVSSLHYGHLACMDEY